MVMPVGLVKVTCLDCGWSCTRNQKSDVLMLPKVCGKCGGISLHLSYINSINAFLNKLGRVIKKINR